MENVLLVTFPGVREPDAGWGRLEELREDGVLRVHAAATVRRDADGRFEIVDTHGRGMTSAAAGGAAGAMIGALAGPLGAVVGGTAGAAVGMVAGAEEAAESEGIAARMTQLVPPGTAALIAEVDELDPGAVDIAMESVGGRVTRRPRAAVQAEIFRR